MQRHSLLLVGDLRRELSDTVAAAARDAGVELEVAANAEEAATSLEHDPPLAVVVSTGSPFAKAVCLSMRSEARLADVPIIGLARDVSDLSFADMYAWGGDDVVPIAGARGLVPRLRTLPTKMSLHPASFKGGAIVASADSGHRVLVARVLRNAGYDVRFALDAREARAAAADEAVKLVVVDEVPGRDGAVAVVREARAGGLACAWVVVAEPKRLAAVRSEARGIVSMAVTDRFAPPENVIFVANELTRLATAVEARESARLLYGTAVWFRMAGRDEDAIGCTYNVSAGGIYVRTLAPLSPGDEVWLELTPPRADRRVRLEGKVAWRRTFGVNDTATVPPGFGVQIVGGSTGDLARYRAGYEALSIDLCGPPAA